MREIVEPHPEVPLAASTEHLVQLADVAGLRIDGKELVSEQRLQLGRMGRDRTGVFRTLKTRASS